MKHEYEILDIAPSNPIKTEFYHVESDWSVVVDGINRVAMEINNKTGETRPYDYEQAVLEMFGR
jgi:hypothetical protein